MSELGNIKGVSVLAIAKNTAAIHAAKGKSKSDSAASTVNVPEQTVEPAGNKPAAKPDVAENLSEKLIEVMDERESLIHSMDMSFGVEKLTYKKMWKTLKTVTKEIGEIKEANTDRFALGVTERLEKVPSLMEFTSFSDYLSSEMKNINEDAWKTAGTALAHDVVKEAVAARKAYGDISPHRVAFLLSGVVQTTGNS